VLFPGFIYGVAQRTAVISQGCLAVFYSPREKEQDMGELTDVTRPQDRPDYIAQMKELNGQKEELEHKVECAGKELHQAIRDALNELSRNDALAFNIFMKREFEKDSTKDNPGKKKSFRKIAEELGIKSHLRDPRHAEKLAWQSYQLTCRLLESKLWAFQEKHIQLKRQLRELISS
jgi:hypothetical protein